MLEQESILNCGIPLDRMDGRLSFRARICQSFCDLRFDRGHTALNRVIAFLLNWRAMYLVF